MRMERGRRTKSRIRMEMRDGAKSGPGEAEEYDGKKVSLRSELIAYIREKEKEDEKIGNENTCQTLS